MRCGFFSIFLIILLFSCQEKEPPHGFPPIAPEEVGFSQIKLDSLSEFLENEGSSSLVILVDGKLAYSWGDVNKKLTVHSIRKALLNSIFGIYVANGTIDTSETIGELGIDDIYPLSELEKSARVADLLKSRSGIYHPAAAVSEGMLRGMPERNSFSPGEHYYYNNWDFNMLGYILELKTGEKIYELFLKDIARPIGMKSYQGNYTTIDITEDDLSIPKTDGFYQYERDKSKYPAYHFRLTAMDLARYGQLYLQNGNWDGKQIIDSIWIAASTKPYSIVYEPAGLAYGMLWRVLMKTETRSSSSFLHTGTGIHMIAVYPASNMVLIHRVDTENEYSFDEQDFYQMIDLVWGAKVN